MTDSQATVFDPEDHALGAASAALLPAASSAGGTAASDDEIEIISGGGPDAGPAAAPAHWCCVLCTARNAPQADSCSTCAAFRGQQYNRKNFWRSSLIHEPTQVTPWLFIGSAASAQGAWLHQRFFTHIVCVQEPSGPAECLGQDYVHLPVPASTGAALSPAGYAACLQLMAPAFALLTRCRQTPGARALVHCEHGISRSVSVAAAYLLEHPDALHPPLPLRASGLGVLAFIRSKRPAANPAAPLAAAVVAFGNRRRSSSSSSSSGASGGCTVV